MKGRIAKRAVYEYVRGRRDQAQISMDHTSSDNKLRLSRLMGRRDAFDDLLGALEENEIPNLRSTHDSNKTGGSP